MTITVDGVLKWLPMLITLAGVLLVSRNARRANSTQMQNVDLARIRDLRSELAETKVDLDQCKQQVEALADRLTEANRVATGEFMLRQEMLRYAEMPGVDMEMWLSRFRDEHPSVGR
jgi:uncharacterized coiled-coil protein SlyX